jgi:hypothetical protein
LNVFGKFLDAERGDGLRRRMVAEQRAGGAIDALVGGLGGQHHGNQQLIRRGVIEFGRRRRVGGGETAEKFANLGGRHERCLLLPRFGWNRGGLG